MIRSPTYSKREHIELNDAMVTPGGVGRRRSWRSARVASVAYCFTTNQDINRSVCCEKHEMLHAAATAPFLYLFFVHMHACMPWRVAATETRSYAS